MPRHRSAIYELVLIKKKLLLTLSAVSYEKFWKPMIFHIVSFTAERAFSLLWTVLHMRRCVCVCVCVFGGVGCSRRAFFEQGPYQFLHQVVECLFFGEISCLHFQGVFFPPTFSRNVHIQDYWIWFKWIHPKLGGSMFLRNILIMSSNTWCESTRHLVITAGAWK